MATTTYKVSIQSSDSATNVAYSEVFTIEEKIEEIIKLNNTSKTIDFSHIDNPRILNIHTSQPVTITIVQNANTIEFECDSVFSMRLDPTFFSSITSLSITESNSVDTSVNIQIFGFTPSA